MTHKSLSQTCEFSERSIKRAICQPTGGGFKKTREFPRLRLDTPVMTVLLTFRNKSRRDIHIYYQSL